MNKQYSFEEFCKDRGIYEWDVDILRMVLEEVEPLVITSEQKDLIKEVKIYLFMYDIVMISILILFVVGLMVICSWVFSVYLAI